MPFSLGLLVVNEGYGVANDLRIASSQPTIIDNEKGLLVNFQIVASETDGASRWPILTVEFGDIEPHTTRMVRWTMTSSLTGTFSNYSATFINKNPFGIHLFIMV